jgi:hypothetical protein
MARSLKHGTGLAVGIDHPEYAAEVPALPPAIRNSLVGDLA